MEIRFIILGQPKQRADTSKSLSEPEINCERAIALTGSNGRYPVRHPVFNDDGLVLDLSPDIGGIGDIEDFGYLLAQSNAGCRFPVAGAVEKGIDRKPFQSEEPIRLGVDRLPQGSAQ